MSAGTVYTEIDLGTSKFDAAQKRILYDAKTMAINVEDAWKNLGQKSDVMYNAMRQQAENAYARIAATAKQGSAEQVRAEEAKNEKIKALNEEQFGHQTSLLETFKSHWIAVSAAGVAAYMLFERAYSFGRDIASTTMDIQRQSGVLGLSTSEFQKWQYAAKISDVEAEALSTGFKFLSRNMEEVGQGTGKALKYFQMMGISVKDSVGNLRPLNDVMRDVASRFASWEDGPRKIAIALALFGRGGEAIVPLLDKGKVGIENYWKEAERLGILLSPELIKKGAEAEEIFKRLEARWKAGKMELSPLVLEFAKIIEKLDEFRRVTAATEIGFFKKEEPKPGDLGRSLGIAGTPDQVRELARQYGVGYTDFAKVQEQYWTKLGVFERKPGEFKVPAPAVEDYAQSVKDAEEKQKAWMEAYIHGTEVQYTRIIETYDFDKAKQAFVKKIKAITDWGVPLEEYRRPTLITFDDIQRQLEAFGTGMGESTLQITYWDNALQANNTILVESARYTELLKDQNKSLGQSWRDLSKDYETEWGTSKFLKAPEGYLPSGFVGYKGQVLPTKQYEAEVTQWAKTWDGFCTDFSSSFSSGLVDIFKNGKAGWQTFLENIASVFERTVATMITNWVLFGNLIGYQKELPIGGLFGSLGNLLGLGGGAAGVSAAAAGASGYVSPFSNPSEWSEGGYFEGLQHGGSFWTHGPTPFMAGEGGESEFVSVTPKSKMKGASDSGRGGNTYVYFYNPIGFDERLMKSMGTIIKGVVNDTRLGGPMRIAIKGA